MRRTMALALVLGGGLASCRPLEVYLTSEIDEDVTRRLDETTYTNTVRGPTTTDERVPESENQAGGNTIVVVPVPGGSPNAGGIVVPSGGGASGGGGVTGGGVTTGGATRPGTSTTPGTSTGPRVPPTAGTSPGTAAGGGTR